MGAQGFDYDRIQRIVVIAGMVVVFGLWLAEEAGLIRTAAPHASAVIPLSALPGLQSSAEGLALQGVIAGSATAPGIAILAATGKRPVLVAEGAYFNEDIRVERVLPDRVLLRLRGDTVPVVLPLSPQPAAKAR